MVGKEILNYKIVSCIGHGGMGSVYYAEHKLIAEQKAAIKVIKADMVNDFTRDMLKEEAKRLASLNHNNIVSLHDYHVDNEGNVYLVMEYAEGQNLEDFINKTNGLIVEERVCAIFDPILDAVGYAHKKGILHRDIKPANVMVGPDGSAKILDFGISQIIKENGEEESTEKVMIMGTPSYMSPEQVNGGKLDARSDIYSLGVMLHQMLTGNPPYDTTTLTEQEIEMKVVKESLPRMKTYYKYVSDKVQAVVDKATAKDPKKRYHSCEEFKRALHRAIYPWKPSLGLKIAAVLGALVILVGGFLTWDYFRVKTEYYKDYTEQWGIPVGVGKVSSPKHREKTYRFEYRKGKLRRVSTVNSLGNLIETGTDEFGEAFVDQEFSYTADDKIHNVKVKDRNGKVLYVKSYNDKLNTMIYQYDDEHGTERTLKSNVIGEDKSDGNQSAISRMHLTYDDKGRVIEKRFADINNTPACDANNVYGIQYTYDDRNRTTEIRYIGPDGSPQSTKWGLGIVRAEWDDDDNMIAVSYLTLDEKPAFNEEGGFTNASVEYDKYGNRTRVLFKDDEGNNVYSKKDGYAGYRNTFDDGGFCIKSESLDIDGNLMFVSEVGYAYTEKEYDDNGYISKESHYDEDGLPVEDNSGIAVYEVVNDDRGNQIELWFKNAAGDLTATENGLAGVTNEYDSIGNQTKIIFYDTNKDEYEGNNGYAAIEYEYDSRNLEVKEIFLDKNMDPTLSNTNIGGVKIEYDKRGNMVKRTFVGTDGETPICNTSGVAEITGDFDERGNLISESFRDDKGRLVLHPDYGYATVKNTYDENGYLKSERYYDDKNALVSPLSYNSGIVGSDFKNDDRGNVIEVVNIGEDGVSPANGYLMIVKKYDDNNNLIEWKLLDHNRKPAENNADTHRIAYKYNSRNELIEEACYGLDGSLVNGYLTIFEYDNQGRKTKEGYKDKNKAFCDGPNGYSILAMEYDKRGNLIKESYLDSKGKPVDENELVPIIIYEYDKYGNQTYCELRNGQNKRINLHDAKYGIIRAKYDSRGNRTELAYFDKDDKKALKDGYHRLVSTYHKDGKLQKVECFGVNNEKVNADYYCSGITGGCQLVVYEYSDTGAPLKRRSYTKDNELVLIEEYCKGNWVDTEGYWKTLAQYYNAFCPLVYDVSNLKLTSFKAANGTECRMRFDLPYYANELSQSKMNAVKAKVRELVVIFERECGENPPYVYGELYDRTGKKIYEVKI